MTSRHLTTDGLADRIDALGRFVRAMEGHLAGDALADARTLVEQGIARLRLSGEHTVVALAGSTGGGKSSLFNAVARMQLSPSGHLRPTTADAHACVWSPEGADPLLDWLGVDPSRRFARESVLDAEDEAPLRGLVLLDLPDMDSVATSHRLEVDRLVGIVDLLVWVLDPQKYADRTVHEEYLRHMGALRDVTVVVLNQVDRLSVGDTARCLADLARLVEADGLPGVPLIATSALTGDGVGELRTHLEKTVSGRQASLVRLEGELDVAVAAFAPLVGPDVEEDAVTRDVVRDLAGELAAASGVSGVAREEGQAYARRAAVPAWPLRRRTPRGRAEVPPAQAAAVGLAVRNLAGRAAAGLPPPWPEEVWAAASADLPALPGELGKALSAARPRRRRHWGWGFVRLLWWLCVGAALGGAGWLAWYGVRRARGQPAAEPPDVGGVWVPLLLLAGGVLVAVLLSLLARPLAAARARRARTRSERRLTDAATSVARERVITPVRAVLRDYADARAALTGAAAPADLALNGDQLTLRPAVPLWIDDERRAG